MGPDSVGGAVAVGSTALGGKRVSIVPMSRVVVPANGRSSVATCGASCPAAVRMTTRPLWSTSRPWTKGGCESRIVIRSPALPGAVTPAVATAPSVVVRLSVGVCTPPSSSRARSSCTSPTMPPVRKSVRGMIRGARSAETTAVSSRSCRITNAPIAIGSPTAVRSTGASSVGGTASVANDGTPSTPCGVNRVGSTSSAPVESRVTSCTRGRPAAGARRRARHVSPRRAGQDDSHSSVGAAPDRRLR